MSEAKDKFNQVNKPADETAPVTQQTKEELEATLKEEERIALQREFDRRVEQEVQKRKNLEVLNSSRVVIMVPMGSDYVHQRWSFQLWNLQRQVPSQTEFIPVGQYGIGYARQRAANMFSGMPPDFTHLLFLDSDIIASDFALTNLLQDDKDVVSGIYANSLHTGLAAWYNEQPLQFAQIMQTNKVDPLIQVDKVGLGLCLIKRDVFKMLLSVEQPHFYYKVNEVGPHSEDFYFFSILKRLGIKTYVDIRVQGLHLKPAVVAPSGQVSL